MKYFKQHFYEVLIFQANIVRHDGGALLWTNKKAVLFYNQLIFAIFIETR